MRPFSRISVSVRSLCSWRMGSTASARCLRSAALAASLRTNVHMPSSQMGSKIRVTCFLAIGSPWETLWETVSGVGRSGCGIVSGACDMARDGRMTRGTILVYFRCQLN